MKIDVNMQPTDKLIVDGWWADNPAFVVASVIKQLKAASAIWPELEKVSIGVPNELLPK